MSVSPVYLALEGEVARAHRALHRAAASADIENLEDLTFELELIRDELAKIQEHLLLGRKRRTNF